LKYHGIKVHIWMCFVFPNYCLYVELISKSLSAYQH